MAKKTSRLSRILARSGQLAVYVLYRFFETVVYFIPLRWIWQLGEFLGTGCYYLLPKYRRLARHNLAIAFGGEKSEDELRVIARRHFAALGRNLLCSVKMALIPLDKVDELVTIEGGEGLEDIAKAGEGAVAAIPHLGMWELIAHLRSMGKGIEERSVIYQKLGNELLDRHVRRQRSRSGLVMFDRKAGFHQPIQMLRDGGGAAVLVDQHAGDSGVWCPFFNRLASTSNLAALFASRTGCKVFPVGIFPDGIGRWKLVYDTPLDPKKLDPKDGASRLTAELNIAVENLIRRAPEEWFWVHNRWKTPNPNFLLTGYKRGVYFPEGFDPEKSLQPFHILVRSPNHLGDACMAVPAVKAIKRGRPDAVLTVLCPENLVPLWRRVDEVDQVIARGGGESVFAVANKTREAATFDVGILLTNSLRTALEMKLAGLPRIAGYAGHYRRWLLNQVMPPKQAPARSEHHARFYLRLAKRLGADVSDALPGNDCGNLRMPRRGETVRIGICAGAVYGPAKQWPLDSFAAMTAYVAERIDVEWVIFGGPSEAGLGNDLAGRIGGKVENLAGRTSMEELMNEIGRCRLLVTNDTGTMHLADFLGVPTVAIFGSTEPRRTRPIGRGHRIIRRHVECAPCYLRKCPRDFRCMTEVTVDQVADAVLDELGAGGEQIGSGRWAIKSGTR